MEARIAKQILGGVASLLNGADELRNARGTGHGRSGAPLVDTALARMTVGVVMAAVVYLIEVFESQTDEGAAPELLRRLEPTLPALAVASLVSHETFGRGTILALHAMEDANSAEALVDFGPGVGTKRIALSYAKLALFAE